MCSYVDSVMQIVIMFHIVGLLDDSGLLQVECPFVEDVEHLVAGEDAAVHQAVYAHLGPKILLLVVSWAIFLGGNGAASLFVRVVGDWSDVLLRLGHEIHHLQFLRILIGTGLPPLSLCLCLV